MTWAGKTRAKLVSGVGLIIGGTAFVISQFTKTENPAAEKSFEIVAATVVTFPVTAPLMLAAVVCDGLDR